MNWHAVLPDNSHKGFESPNKSFRCSYWIKVIDTGKTYTTSLGTVHHIFSYETFNNDLEKMHLEVCGWKAIDFNDPPNKNAYEARLKVSISDPSGFVRTIFTDNWLKGVINTLERLTKLSVFDSWQMYDLHNEKEKLKNANLNLKNEIKDLELKIDAFQSTPFYTKLLKKFSSLQKGEQNPSKSEITSFIKSNNLNRKFFDLWLNE